MSSHTELSPKLCLSKSCRVRVTFFNFIDKLLFSRRSLEDLSFITGILRFFTSFPIDISGTFHIHFRSLSIGSFQKEKKLKHCHVLRSSFCRIFCDLLQIKLTFDAFNCSLLIRFPVGLAYLGF